MIRDEYKKEEYENLSTKDIQILKDGGARALYASKIARTNKGIKSFDFLSKFFVFLSAILTIVIMLTLIFKLEIAIGFTIFIIFDVAFILEYLLWFTIIKPKMKKALVEYKKKIDELIYIQINKQNKNK